MISKHRDKVLDQKDHEGLNIISFCIQEYSWDCLSEIVFALGNQILDRADESTLLTPSEFAQKIGYEKAYTNWLDSICTGNKINWIKESDLEEGKTMIMFHGKEIIMLLILVKFN